MVLPKKGGCEVMHSGFILPRLYPSASFSNAGEVEGECRRRNKAWSDAMSEHKLNDARPSAAMWNWCGSCVTHRCFSGLNRRCGPLCAMQHLFLRRLRLRPPRSPPRQRNSPLQLPLDFSCMCPGRPPPLLLLLLLLLLLWGRRARSVC